MKILILHNKFPYPAKDGGSIAVLNLAKSLANIGHQITFLCFNTSKHYFNLKKLPKELKQCIDFRTVYLKSDINPLKALFNLLFSRLPYIAQRFKTKLFSKELSKVLTENSFDIVQIEGLYMCQYIPVIKKFSKAKIAYRAHNIEHEIWQRTVQSEKNFLQKMYLKNLSKRLKRFEVNTLNSYDLLVPISHRDTSILNALGNTKPSIINIPGIDLNEKYIHSYQHKTNLFFLGALDWKPNQEGLVWFFESVWPEIWNRSNHLTLSIAGRNAPAWLEKKIKQQSNVNYLGEIEEVEEFISTNGIMIAPLLSGSGIRIKIIEGLAYGKIIITSTIGAEGLDVEDKKNIFIADTKKEYMKCIDSILSMDESEIKSFQKNAQDFYLNNFDNLASANKLSKFYIEHNKK